MKPSLRLMAFLVLTFAACGDAEVRLDGLARAAEQRATSHDGAPISLAKETGFTWDRVFIFPPYTPESEVLREIGVPWDDVERTGIATRDDAVLLVFVRSGAVTAFAMHPRHRGDLAEVRARGGLTPAQALFVARRVDRGGPWVALELAQVGEGEE